MLAAAACTLPAMGISEQVAGAGNEASGGNVAVASDVNTYQLWTKRMARTSRRRVVAQIADVARGCEPPPQHGNDTDWWKDPAEVLPSPRRSGRSTGERFCNAVGQSWYGICPRLPKAPYVAISP